MSIPVFVVFEVTAENTAAAEKIVDDRLTAARLLWENDSTDVERGTLDPINTFAVVPVGDLLEASL